MKNTSDSQTVICIAGAHRSGTSLVTRLLHCCGLELGPESDLMPAQADNPEGFWEHLGFVALNDELLNELGGAWDLPPRHDESLTGSRLDPFQLKARLLIERFASAHVWGWKDPRNSLTLPFWHNVLPGLKTLVVVRNPLEVAHSMRERNGTSFSFGLRLWEIYNRRLLETAAEKDRLVTHYDSFFKDTQPELRRIAQFAGLSDKEIGAAAALVSPRRRHVHFSIDDMIDARVSGDVIELYRALVAEASATRKPATTTRPLAKSDDADLLPGSVSRLLAFVPERIAQVEQLYRELLAQTEARHKDEVEKLSGHLAQTEAQHEQQIKETEARHKSEVKAINADLTQIEVRHKSEVRAMSAHLAKVEGEHKRQVEELAAHFTATEEHYKGQIEEITTHYTGEVKQLRDRVAQISDLLHRRSVSLAESEAQGELLRNRLRQQLRATQRLSRLLNDADEAAARLRSSARWQIANPVAALKTKLSPKRSRDLMGYGHLEKVVSTYQKWRSAHPEVATIDDEIQALISDAPSTTPPPKPTGIAGSPQAISEPPAPTRPVAFPAHEHIEVSIIIPVCNQFRYTHACLASLQEHQANHEFEVIVVDDCSTDATAKDVPQMAGVVYVRNETNSGFVVSCNRGAEKARGKYLVFLNNDTVVSNGWLQALLDTFVEQPKAGIVGSKLIYPDGRLQEAGGIIWRDGSGWNYGKFDDPQKPEFNYLRQVDYCSAAALMIPKALFESFGGFDSRYAPGYYEDTDLAFKVRQAGYKVLYQPLSEVVHYEGATGGTDLSAGAKKYQEINRSNFVKAWAAELATKPVNSDVISLRQPPLGRKSVLVIDHHVPMPDRDSGSLRMFQILTLLHQLGHRVTFIPDNLAKIPPYGAELQKRGIQLIHHPYVQKVRDYLVSHGSEFDVIVLSRCQFANKHIDDVRTYAPQARTIFDTVDLHFVREAGEARITSDLDAQRKAEETQQVEYDLIERSDETWTVSSSELRLLQAKWPDKSIQLVSNIVDVPGSKTPFALRRDWLFIGSFQHTPNVDAILFFVQEIYPLVSDHLRGAKFYIIGDKAPPEVVALANENIVVAGLQRDARPFFESVRLSIAPLRFGAGVKGKINQSMGFGVPVVATSVAVDGTELRDRQEILVADTPEQFARVLVELYESEELWNRLSKNGISKTRALYSIEAARKKLEFLFSDAHLKNFERSPSVPEQELVAVATS